jgi:hypothetical protein
MSLLTVVQDVCAVVGVSRPSSIFSGLNSSRTQQEMLALANEMAQRIAYNTREWGVLTTHVSYTPDMALPQQPPPFLPVNPATYSLFSLPADYKRMLLATNVRRKSTPLLVMRFVPDDDEWLMRRAAGYYDARGEWHLSGDVFFSVSPPLFDLRTLPPWANGAHYTVSERVVDAAAGTFWANQVDHTSAATGTFAADRAAHKTYWTEIFQDQIFFPYLHKNCITLAAGGAGNTFQNDNDIFRIDERLLKLGMIWQWKASKGSPYAEDMGTYSDALAVAAGADKPAPIIIGRMPISAATNVALPWPPTWGPQP